MENRELPLGISPAMMDAVTAVLKLIRRADAESPGEGVTIQEDKENED